jgi:hypothetical protein
MKTVTWLKKKQPVFTKIDDNPQVTTLITDSYPHNIPQPLKNQKQLIFEY